MNICIYSRCQFKRLYQVPVASPEAGPSLSALTAVRTRHPPPETRTPKSEHSTLNTQHSTLNTHHSTLNTQH